MIKNKSAINSYQDNQSYLPNFCHSETNLLLILVLELIAMVLALASETGFNSLFIHLALISMYIQWIGLSSAALLCLLRRYRVLNRPVKTTILSLLVVTVMTAIMATVAYQLNVELKLEMFKHHSLLTILLYHEAMSLIIFGLALRYFFIQFSAQQVIKAESKSRLQALQARIRPHFLFNSLNTIASLTHADPDKAEHAIEDLSELFRASLKAESQISLESEIELTMDYINLELLRLNERLQVHWDIKAEVKELMMPALILQPLVENAIYHGIEPLQEGGEVNISIESNQDLHIQITNPWNDGTTTQRRQGNQMALENISERLQLAFHGQAKIEHFTENDLYKVIIKIPITKT